MENRTKIKSFFNSLALTITLLWRLCVCIRSLIFQFEYTTPKYESLNNILELKNNIAETLGSKDYIFKTNHTQPVLFLNNEIIIEQLNPKLATVPDSVMNQLTSKIKESCVQFIDNVDSFNQITLVLKWPENNIEKKKTLPL
ncbi:hypothetical protein KZP23_07345 [Echinicola marina]|uniref:hypothetical protein n=1 Tax=Echinicola marina TaxID=2859768 RepID=UPI001CF6EFEC|nr:hypothetical protein [Echinicola marina]UCS94815.1 hypothetical protein KZP23_07345 [Echinicola marina]